MITSLLTTFGAECASGHFFGLIPWYQYINDKYNAATGTGHFIGCEVQSFNIFSDTPLVLLAVVDDLLRIAGLVAVAFVFYGAIRYVASQGNPEDTANAQSTIIHALLGMAIAIVSVIFVSFLGDKLGG
jgi:hypothetical protein